MSLKAVFDSQDEIPSQVNVRDLYTERNGKWELTGIPGIQTDANVARIEEVMRKEKNDHRQTREKLKAWDGLDYEDVRAKLDEYDELKIKANSAGKLNQEQIDQLVETRLKTKMSPIERANKELTEKLQAATEQITTYQARETQRVIHDDVRKALIAAKVIDVAHEDALMLADRVFEVGEDGKVRTKDQVGVTPGVAPDVWLTEMQSKRPHWWPESQGGGAKGGKGGGGFPQNPWSSQHWNLTEQGRMVKENPARAEQMAKAAGSYVGAYAPTAQKSA